MIRLLLSILIFSTYKIALGQNQSMTISHTGLSPNDTLWVTPGEQIDFIFGGGGSHPMTSGQGTTASPVFFPTVTVTSTDPLATFSLTTIGTYIFHCGTNPSNTANWGTIIVQELASIDESNAPNSILLYPSPANELLKINANTEGSYRIHDLSGKTLLDGDLVTGTTEINIADLKKGQYLFVFTNGKDTETIRFTKD